MPSIETLQAKRVALVDSQTQLVGQINRVGGAIAVIDELINEEQASQAAQAKAEAETATAWAEKVACIRKSMEAHPCPPPPPEMLPVSRFEPCDNCSTSRECELSDTCRATAYTGPDGAAA